jgi:hypothetical protein
MLLIFYEYGIRKYFILYILNSFPHTITSRLSVLTLKVLFNIILFFPIPYCSKETINNEYYNEFYVILELRTVQEFSKRYGDPLARNLVRKKQRKRLHLNVIILNQKRRLFLVKLNLSKFLMRMGHQTILRKRRKCNQIFHFHLSQKVDKHRHK